MRVDFVFFTPHTGKHVTSATWKPKPIFEDRLASGRLLLITQSKIPIDQATAIKFDAVRAMGRAEGEKHEKDASRALARFKIHRASGAWLRFSSTAPRIQNCSIARAGRNRRMGFTPAGLAKGPA